MKRNIFLMIAIVAMFGLAIAAYAYSTVSAGDQAKACCCKSSDSCPMKNQGGEHAKTEGKSCCDDCCGDSCPMKKGEAAAGKTEDGKCCDDCKCCGKDKHHNTEAA